MGVEVSKEKVMGNHVEMPLLEASTGSDGHRRVPVSDALVNRYELVLVKGGVCPLCGRRLDPPPMAISRRVRFVVGDITPKQTHLFMGEPSQ